MKRKSVNTRIEMKVSEQPAPRANEQVERRREESPDRSDTESLSSSSLSSYDEMSIDGSCVSSEADEANSGRREEAAMVLVGCPRCMMYVMLSEENPMCPRCHSTVLLDFLNDQSSSSETDD